MIIGIQRGLDSLKKELEQKGYNVVYYDQYKNLVDVYVYNSHEVEGVYNNIEVTNSSLNFSDRKNMGVLMINTRNKNVDQIEDIIHHRYYSPLF